MAPIRRASSVSVPPASFVIRMMDGGSFETFYRETRDGCFRALLVAVGDADEAADVLAEAYTRALARWGVVESHPAPEAWVLRTALNLHRDRWRRRREHGTRGGMPYLVAAPDLPVDPALLAALWALPSRQRQVVALRVVLDLDGHRTAEILGITPGTVTTHLHRALSTLRKTFESERTG